MFCIPLAPPVNLDSYFCRFKDWVYFGGGEGVENLRQLTQVGDKTDLWVTPNFVSGVCMGTFGSLLVNQNWNEVWKMENGKWIYSFYLLGKFEAFSFARKFDPHSICEYQCLFFPIAPAEIIYGATLWASTASQII